MISSETNDNAMPSNETPSSIDFNDNEGNVNDDDEVEAKEEKEENVAQKRVQNEENGHEMMILETVESIEQEKKLAAVDAIFAAGTFVCIIALTGTDAILTQRALLLSFYFHNKQPRSLRNAPLHLRVRQLVSRHPTIMSAVIARADAVLALRYLMTTLTQSLLHRKFHRKCRPPPPQLLLMRLSLSTRMQSMQLPLLPLRIQTTMSMRCNHHQHVQRSL
jgi:hypothetical protein